MLKKAVICIRLGSVFALIVGIYLIYFALTYKEVSQFGIFLLVLVSIVMVLWWEITIIGLKNQKRWAWKSSLVIFALYIPSLFIILGIVGMKSVLSNSVIEQFYGKKADEAHETNKVMNFAEVSSKIKSIPSKDESDDEYLKNNPALQRYLSYHMDTEKKTD